MLKNTSYQKSNQKKVLISGSRTQKYLPKEVQNSLELIKKQSFEILIGDSNKGIDNLIAKYLKIDEIYPYVSVFSISNVSRFKVEDVWNFRQVTDYKKSTTQQNHMQKDRVMADEADYGLSIFKPVSVNRFGNIEVSSGTLRNTIQLLLNKKPVKFFYIYENKIMFQNLKELNDLKKVLDKYQHETLAINEQDEIKNAKGYIDYDNLALSKYTRIITKYNEICKIEKNMIIANDALLKNGIDEVISFE